MTPAIAPLSRVMVAPNGARRTKADHPALPITVAEVVDCALACHAVGADGLHAHVRDASGAHVLDAGLYAELLAELTRRAPTLFVQVTTEAVGRFSAAEQRKLVHDLRPPAVSIALREILSDGDEAANARLFAFCDEAGIAVQHILFTPEEATQLAELVARGVVPKRGLQVLHVLGRYTPGQVSSPADLDAPLAAGAALQADWAVCAFGRAETACLAEAVRRGGKARVGFENNLHNADGRIARDNAERVAEVVAAIGALTPA
jgi:uncharacterized protein (DUF849 family)